MIGFPFDSRVTYEADGSPVYDRAITSEPYRKLLRELFKTGVMPNPSTNMQVTAGEGLKVVVLSGFAMVNGLMKLEESNVNVSLSTADTTYNRIDTIVLRLNDNANVRTCEYAVITGTPSSNPVAPDLVRSNSIYDIGLANVLVRANSTQVSQANITDTRYDSDRCGVVSSISEFDTTTLYDQIESDLDEFKTEYEDDMTTWTTQQKADFIAWVDTIKNILDQTTAGHLQNEIDTINDDLSDIKDDVDTLFEEKANKEDINKVYGTSDEYSATTSYSVDDMCIYNGKLWKCLVACIGQTPSEGTYWTNVSLNSLYLSSLKVDLNLGLIGSGLTISKTVPSQYRGRVIVGYYIEHGNDKYQFINFNSDDAYFKGADYAISTGIFTLYKKDAYAYNDWNLHIVI